MPDLIVTLVQADLAWEDRQANLAGFTEALDTLPEAADLIVLPEMFNTGFSMNPSRLAEPMDGPSVAWLLAQARRRKADIVASLIIREQGRYFNRLLWAGADGRLLSYDKRHLIPMLGEDREFSAGDRLLTVERGGWRIRPFVCYDLRFPVWTRNIGNRYDLALYIASWPAARREHWKLLLQARAVENLSYVVGVNRVGVDGNGVAFAGDSAVIGPAGEVLCSEPDRPAIRTLRLSYDELQAFREKFPAWKDADAGLVHLPE